MKPKAKRPEVWKQIPGFPNYDVSNYGRIISYALKEPKLLKPGVSSSGHLTVALTGHVSKCVHALVLLAFVGPCPAGMEVLHRNGVKTDNRLTNVHYDTRSENGKDASRHGKSRFREGDIRAMRASGKSGSALARDYGVSQALISKILMGEIYQWVTPC